MVKKRISLICIEGEREKGMLKHIKEQEFEKEISSGINIVNFYASWCGPCLILDQTLEELSNSRTEYNILKIDVDENKKIVNSLGVDTVPSLYIYKDGEFIDKQIGCISKKDLIKFIEEKIK